MRTITRVVLICTAAFCTSALTLRAQVFTPVSDTTINACQGVFQDSGGESGGYGPDEQYSVTVCPEAGGGSHVKMIFSEYDLGDGESLCFYDGLDSNAPELGCAQTYLEPFFIVQATIANASGCLTIEFSSDNIPDGEGWEASISCIQACQNIFVELDSTSIPIQPADTGYIDACPGERIAFSGRGIYPQNNTSYTQSDLSSTFEWDFGDGITAVGREVSHVYENSGGYNVQLTITDTEGCTNINFLNQRVRIATKPDFSVLNPLPDQLCVGDTLGLSGTVEGQEPASTISASSTQGSFQSGLALSDSLALPDGNGSSYSTSLSISSFPPGQTLTDVSDLESICVVMEHSWMHDLQVALECPDGTSVLLQDQDDISDEIYLGEPVDGDGLGGSMPEQGEGYEYCWTPESTNGTWTTFSQNDDNNGGGVYTLPSQDYNSFEQLDSLIGCPLNGEWTITVTDLWQSDNGWIFEWGINFDASLYPEPELFEPALTRLYWESNNTIFDYQGDSTSVMASPPYAGNLSYRVISEDEYGCQFDTLLALPVLPYSHPDCYECVDNIGALGDTVLCINESTELDAGDTEAAAADAAFVAEPRAFFESVEYPPGDPFRSSIAVNSVNPAVLTDPENQIESVCVNIETTWNNDLELFLESPDGQLLELSTDNGGNSDNYTNTCFVPGAATPITAGTGPFTGEFAPEGDWSVLLNSTINGDWTIVASDAFGTPFDEGEFVSWSITFASENQINYSWEGPALSCTDCPDPIASPTATTDYVVTSNDSYGCSFEDSVRVGVVTDITAPQVACTPTGIDSITFSWTAVADYTNYEINPIINGTPGGWQGPITGNSYTLGGLAPGAEVVLEVRVFTGGGELGCNVATGTSSCSIAACELRLEEVAITPVSCFGRSDGAISAEASMGDPPYTYRLNGGADQTVAGYDGLESGLYTLVVEDTRGCTDSLNFDINEPDSLSVELQADALIGCEGSSEGIISSLVQGGNGGFEYEWSESTVGDSPTAENLAAGTYQLTVTDSEGCTAADTLSLNEPDPISINFQFTGLDCASDTDGSIEALVSGGVQPFEYTWDNGGSSPQINGLSAGTYCLTVEDANGCLQEACQELLAPPALLLDSFAIQPVGCNGEATGSLTAFVSGGQGAYTYQWDDPLSQIGASASMLAAGAYSLTVVDENNCELVEQATVPEPEPLSVSFAITDVSCQGGSNGQIAAQADGGTAPYTYAWENGQADATADGLSAGTTGLTITDQNGCTLESNAVVEEPDEGISLTVVQTERGCAGASGNVAEAEASGGAGGFSYEWSNGQSTAIVTSLDSVSYTVTATDSRGCTAIASLIPEDLEPITFLIIANPPSCNGLEDGRLGINQISGGNGQTIDDFSISWDTGDQGPTAENLAGGQTYSVTVSDGEGCTRVRNRSLPDPQPVEVALSSDSVSCFGSSDGSASLLSVNGENPPFALEWNTGATGEVLTELSPGFYSLTATDANNCTGADTIEVGAPEELTAELQVTDNDCFGQNGGSIVALPEGGTPAYSYNWSNGSTAALAPNLGAGGYALTLTDTNGCEAILEATVEEPEPIILSLEGQNPTCNGFRDGQIEASVSGGTPPYRYSLDNDLYVASNVQIALPADNYRVYVRDKQGCVVSEAIALEDPPLFTVDAGKDVYEIAMGDSLQLEASTTNGIGEVEYFWQEPFAGTLSCTRCQNPLAQPEASLLYQLLARDSRGCEAEDMLRVIVNKNQRIEVPTGFTPNGDGQNDRLLVHGRAPTQILRFQVFDRWGELVYQAQDFEVNEPEAGWDGDFRGKPTAPGVYIWRAVARFPDGTEESFQGQTTLIR